MIEQLGLSLMADKDGLTNNLKILVPEAHRVAKEYQDTVDSIGKSEVDETQLNKIKQQKLVEMDPESKQNYLNEIANFRHFVLDSVRKDRESVFLIKQMHNEISELIDSIDEMVTREVLPQKKEAEREAKIKDAYALYDKFSAIQELVDRFTGFFSTMVGKVDSIDTSTWTNEDDEFTVKTKKLTDGSIKFSMPKPHSPTTRFGEAKKDTDIVTLTVVITQVGEEKTELTPSEFCILYAQPLTGKFVSEKTVVNKMDKRQDGGKFNFPSDDADNKIEVHWAKSEI